MSTPEHQLLIEEEGRIPWSYPDSDGYATIGVGHLIDHRRGGRLPDAIIDELLNIDVVEKTNQAAKLQGFSRLNPVQQAAIISMVFQLGIGGVMGFPQFVGALSAGDLKKAAAAGLDSKWAKTDTPERAQRQMQMLESGLWVPFEATRK